MNRGMFLPRVDFGDGKEDWDPNGDVNSPQFKVWSGKKLSPCQPCFYYCCDITLPLALTLSVGLFVHGVNELNNDREMAVISLVNATLVLGWTLLLYSMLVQAKSELFKLQWMSAEEAEKVLKEGAEAKLVYRGRSSFGGLNPAAPYHEEDPPFLDTYDVSATPELVNSSHKLGKYLRILILKRVIPADDDAQTCDEGYIDFRHVPELPDTLYVVRGSDKAPWYLTPRAAYCFLWTGLYTLWYIVFDCCCVTTVLYESRKVYTTKPKLPEIIDHLEEQKAVKLFEV